MTQESNEEYTGAFINKYIQNQQAGGALVEKQLPAPIFIKLSDIQGLFNGYARRINYYVYAQYNGVFSPLLYSVQNKIY